MAKFRIKNSGDTGRVKLYRGNKIVTEFLPPDGLTEETLIEVNEENYPSSLQVVWDGGSLELNLEESAPAPKVNKAVLDEILKRKGRITSPTEGKTLVELRRLSSSDRVLAEIYKRRNSKRF